MSKSNTPSEADIKKARELESRIFSFLNSEPDSKVKVSALTLALAEAYEPPFYELLYTLDSYSEKFYGQYLGRYSYTNIH